MKVTVGDKKVYRSWNDMDIGDIGVTKDGSYILRTYSMYVDLESPGDEWGAPSSRDNLVYILPQGTKITLEVE